LHKDNKEKKDEELLVVAPTDAGPQPLAMVIKSVNTVPTKVAVKSSFWSEDEASVAVLYSRKVKSSCTHDQRMHS
jgi:hypothetical protein